MAAATLALLCAGLLWRVVRYAVGFPVWGDEAFVAISLCERTLAGLWQPLAFWQVAPWGFLAAEHAMVVTLGRSEWALRLVPFLAGLAALVLFWRFATRVVDRRSAMLAVGVLAASYYPVRHSAEIKPYSGDLLLALVLTTLGWGLWTNPRSLWRWLALIAVAGVGVWCSFPLVLVAGAAGLLLAVRLVRERPWRRSSLALLFLYGVMVLASWAAMLVLFANPHTRAATPTVANEVWERAYPPIEQPWRLPWWLLEVHTGYMLAYPVGGSGFCSVLTFLCVVAGVVALWHRGQRALLALLLGPLALNFVAAALHRYPYGTSPRVSLYMGPTFCLLAAVGMAWSVRFYLPRRLVPVGTLAVALLLGLGAVVGTGIDLAKPYGRPDDLAHRKLVRRLSAQARPGDQWLIYNGPETRPATSTVVLSQWLQQEAEFRYYLLKRPPVPTRWVFSPLEPAIMAPPTTGRTWLIVHRSGLPLFPDNVAEAMRSILATHLGPPQTTTVAVTRHESVTAHIFTPAAPARR